MKIPAGLAAGALGAALLVSFPDSPSAAESPGSAATEKYIAGQGAQFESLAGSRDNLSSLAYGLRTGSTVTLAEETPAGPRFTRFDPATGRMGYGNITRSLTLAERHLHAVGITDPTAAELRAALNGGTVTTSTGDVRLQGVLNLRSSGMGWGQIAHTIGVAPGAAQSAGNRGNAAAVSSAAAGGARSIDGRSVSHRGIVTAAGSSPMGGGSAVYGKGNAYGKTGTATGSAAGGTRATIGAGGGHAANVGGSTHPASGSGGISTAIGAGKAGGIGQARGHSGR